MATSQYGRKLDPNRRLREPLGVKGIRQSVVITNNPSSIDQNQQLQVRFPNLGPNDVVVPGTARLAFTIAINASTDDASTVVQNLGRAILKKTTVKISGNEVISVDDSDILQCYTDLWRTPQERKNGQYQGIDTSPGQIVTKLRLGSAGVTGATAAQKAVSETYGSRFYIPLDFELLESHMPFFQSGLGDRLEYELTFNDYSRVIRSQDNTASYKIENISLEYDMVSHPELARMIQSQYSGRLAILYDRILRHRKLVRDKSDPVWNININTPARSMKGVLLIIEDPDAPFDRDAEKFYNPKITKVETTVEGLPNQLYSQGMRGYQMWDETRKHFAGGAKRQNEVAIVAKDLALADVSIEEFLTTKYAMWLDMRTTDDDQLHGSGRRVENASEGITIQITKKVEAAGPLNVYVYLVMDAQLNIEDGRFVSAIF